MSMVYGNAAGTCSVELTIPVRQKGKFQTTLNGCFVKKEANLKHFLERFIASSADRNIYERSEYLFYSPINDFKAKKVTKAVINYAKISEKWRGPRQKTETCTVYNPMVITCPEHFFLCCDSEDLNKSRFLAECSKEVRIDQDLGTRQSFYGIGVEGHCLQFIFLESNIKQLQNHVYKVKYKNEFEKLLEVGPLLLGDKKTLVGCYRKTADGNYSIEIDIFGKQGKQDVLPTGSSESSVSLQPGIPGDQAPASLAPSPLGDQESVSLPLGPSGVPVPAALPTDPQGVQASATLPPSPTGYQESVSLPHGPSGVPVPAALPPSPQGDPEPVSLAHGRPGEPAPAALPPSPQGDPESVSLAHGRPGEPAPADSPPSPQGANQQLEHQDPATVTLKFNHLMIEATRCLEDYIARESGTLANLKYYFRGLLPEEPRTRASTVNELLEALEEHSVIGANNVRLLKVLAEEIQLRELKEKIEKFEADCPRKVEKPFAVIHLKTVVLVLGVELALAGANLMYMFTTNPDTLQSLWDFGIQLFSILKGSVVFVLRVPSLSSLQQLWQSYKDGSLKERLKYAFNEMEELIALSRGKEIDLEVTIDEGEYRKVLWDLIQLEVKGCDGLKQFLFALESKECKQTTLDISGNQIGDDGLKSLSDALTTTESKLKTLDISKNRIRVYGMKYLSNSLATTECELTTLDISRNCIRDDGLKYLSDTLAAKECKLTTLDISRNNLSDNGLKYLSDALATNECKLTSLNVSGNQIWGDGLKYLSDALATTECKLITLDISRNYLHDNEVKYLSDTIATKECKLTTLDVSRNYIGDKGLKYLSKSLATNECKLTTLDISRNYIRDDGLKYLSKSLATNECKLTTLDISGNRIKDQKGFYKYDAAIFYNRHDERWVKRELIPLLELENDFRCFIQFRDFQADEMDNESISGFLFKCKKNVVVVSKDFLKSIYREEDLHKVLDLQRLRTKSFIVLNLDGVSEDMLPRALRKVPSLNLINLEEKGKWRKWLVKQIKA